MELRKNWISLQLSEAKESFKNSPEWMYYNSPLQEIRSKMNDSDEHTNLKKKKKSEEIEEMA